MEITIAVSLLTYLLGLWDGHYFSLLRDRRKEYNEAADRLRKHLMGENPEAFCMCRSPSAFELDQLERLSHWWRRKPLRRALARYSAAKQDYRQDEVGGIHQNNVPEACAALEALIAFTERR
ncbi:MULTISPECIES: hypothetical protein [unclassified Variovorax]|uniref:hypothetical protein n=1 Tax=unclassified Variovorax TaxID=663243 RepID=UPI003ED0B8B1